MSAVERRPLVTGQRPMTVTDLDHVMAIEVQAYPFPWSRGHFTDSLAAGYLADLRVTGRELIGYCVAMHGVEELHLLNLTVAPAHQGQGHARALLAHLAEAARECKAVQIWLEVRQSNERARRLYERWGFEAIGLRKGYYPAAHGQREHAVVMRWTLDPGAADAGGHAHGLD
ncbi:MAG TPA: ribosomal protein S18-alanine N-acetyltransferase [Ideonella sp.]|uniref:ribosomal protein S18-alanine N-acetyltransferase n=1 Tax=Ideonella sp. TaxID=1929293 RepID=UPI002E2F5C59|nr:ribosomal protein S18-alanine N-acetyltransferase [Ideonella sp.]HEX5687749.1 ribosomal protein S18-alanine N-acetyltransferase [Ideonella sp.]